MEEFHIDAELRSSLDEASEEDLQALAELHEDPANDNQIELYIYLCFLLFQKSNNTQCLEQAIQRAEGWVAVTTANYPDRDRRYSILNTITTWGHHCRVIKEDIKAIKQTNREELATEKTDIHINHLIHQAIELARGFKQTGYFEDLNKAIDTMDLAISTAGEYITPSMLTNLGSMLGTRFERMGSMDDLNRAVRAASDAVDATPHDHPNRAAYLSNLGNRLGRRFQRTGSMDDLNRAVRNAVDAVDNAAYNHPNQATYLNNLATWLGTRFERTGSMDDLDRAVSVAVDAVDATPHDHPNRAMYLNTLGNRLGTRFERMGSMDDLNQAVSVASDALNATPRDHPDRAACFNNLGNWLGRRFERTGSMDDLNRAVSVVSDAVNAMPHDNPNRAMCLGNFGTWLGMRFKRTGSMDDLDRAVRIAVDAVDATPHDHPDRADRLSSLGNRLGRRFERTGSMDDLNRAVSVASDAVDATPHDHPNRAVYLRNLGNLFGMRFQRTGSMGDLNRAVSVTSEAVDATPHDHLSHASFSNSLGTWLGTRFERTGSMDDLERAVRIAVEAMDATPHDHPDRAGRLSSLGNWLCRRFERTGSIDDLNRAVRNAVDAVDIAAYDHPNRAAYSSNLGSMLGRRFERTGSIGDLNRAISVTSDAVDATPYNHPDLAGRLNNLGHWLGTRFERIGSMDDLNQAISVASDAVDATPRDHPDRAAYLSNLGNRLGARFERIGSMDDLNQAISVASDAVDATPRDHPDRAAYLNNLGNRLGTRFERTGSIDDLDRAVRVSSDAVNATPRDHPNRAAYLNNLGNRLGKRFKRTGLIDDLNRQLLSYVASWDCTTAPPSTRIQSAQKAANILIQQQHWEKSYQLLQDAISLLPIISPRSLHRTDAQALLTGVFGLASLAAATALNVGKLPEDALRLLELGRGVIASLLMDMRGDITDLRLQHPHLAEKFTLLRDELDSPAGDATSLIFSDKISSWELQAKRRREADEEFGRVTEQIRAQPGFSHFLQPPAAEDIIGAADQGPIIVVNTSSFRSDAFLIQCGSIQVVELPAMTPEELNTQFLLLQNKSGLSSSLEWLWHTICGPCLNALGFTNPVSDGNWPHVWWIPTGLLSQLPLHAAGIYKQASEETVLDRVISSYASSIKALIYGRRECSIQSSSQASPHGSALIIAMQETPGLGGGGHLQFANIEVNMLKNICPQLQLAPVIPSQRKDDVLKQLPKCKLFHFAGHGRSDPKDPSRSCLLLEDWETNPLTVGEVRDSQLQDNPPFLAYLSACSTGANRETRLADEGIHLISAFQLAGFRHVVGTLWEVSDKHCVDVARILYKTLQEEGMTDMAVSRGLHYAIRALRNGETEDYKRARDATLVYARPPAQGEVEFSWVPYIHFGV